MFYNGGRSPRGRESVELLVNEGANVTSISMDDNNLNFSVNVKYLKRFTDTNKLLWRCARVYIAYHIAGMLPQLLLKLSSIHFSRLLLR